MNTSTAILAAAALIAAAILFVFRYDASGPAPLLLDRWTGTIILCDFDHGRPQKINCVPKE